MNYDKECERLMKANAELALLREFAAEVRVMERVRSQEFADGDSLDTDILVGLLRDMDTALAKLDGKE